LWDRSRVIKRNCSRDSFIIPVTVVAQDYRHDS
jgi:hypothetical protein